MSLLVTAPSSQVGWVDYGAGRDLSPDAARSRLRDGPLELSNDEIPEVTV